tara:strand:+ start:99 stop:293 length:195 start_codon:yes stop_codon:yes gene_type:complete
MAPPGTKKYKKKSEIMLLSDTAEYTYLNFIKQDEIGKTTTKDLKTQAIPLTIIYMNKNEHNNYH